MFRADSVGEGRLLLTLFHYPDNVFGVFVGSRFFGGYCSYIHMMSACCYRCFFFSGDGVVFRVFLPLSIGYLFDVSVSACPCAWFS
jgi:hypothetical protein